MGMNVSCRSGKSMPGRLRMNPAGLEVVGRGEAIVPDEPAQSGQESFAGRPRLILYRA